MPPPPPDRVSAANARRAWWGVVGRLAVCFTFFTLHQRDSSVIPAQAGTYAVGRGFSWRWTFGGGAEAAGVGRRDAGVCSGAGGRLDSCLRRNDGGGAGMTKEGGRGLGRRGRCLGAGGGERGYDGTSFCVGVAERGAGAVGRRGRCLGAGGGEIPAASAGMTELILRGCGGADFARVWRSSSCVCGRSSFAWMGGALLCG